jgi:TonB family protein
VSTLLESFNHHQLNHSMTKYILGLGLLLAASFPTAGHAQKAQADSSSRDQALLEFQVDTPAKLKTAPAPVFPDRLRASGTEGRVLVQFVVDERGRPDMSSFKVLKSTDGELTASVRQAVMSSSFFAAEAGGRKVKQLVQLPFTFMATTR